MRKLFIITLTLLSCSDDVTKPDKFRSGSRRSGATSNPTTSQEDKKSDNANKSDEKQNEQSQTSSEKKYQITVTNGSGSGQYSQGQKITITALEKADHDFKEWTGPNIDLVSNKSSKEIAVTMPNHDISLTATYTQKVAINCNGEIPNHISCIEFKPGPFNEQRVKDWPETSKLTLNSAGYHFSPAFDKSKVWPAITRNDTDGKPRAIIGNLFVVYKSGGKWVSQGFEWQPQDMWPRDFGYVCHDIKLTSGTKIGVLITGVVFFGMKNIEERTSIEWTTLQCN